MKMDAARPISVTYCKKKGESKQLLVACIFASKSLISLEKIRASPLAKVAFAATVQKSAI
jgi:hypothetical protein